MQTLEMEQRKTEAVLAKSAVPKLEMTRVIRASRAKVYEAWTRAEVLQQWFGPEDKMASAATLDVREGGEYAIEVRSVRDGKPEDTDAGPRARVQGVYRQVIPNELLQFTWCGNWDPSETTLVTVSLRDVEGGTELRLTHERFATELSRDKHQHGWSGSLVKLARAFEG